MTPVQSDIGVRFDLLPPNALMSAARVMHEGAEKYGKVQPDGQKSSWDNLKAIPVGSHVNHAMAHLVKWLQGDASGEDHLSHAVVRLMVAKEVAIVTNSLKKQYDHVLELIKKDAESAAKVADSYAKSLEATIASLGQQVKDLGSQLTTARQDAKEVATEALKSASGRQVVDALQQAAVNAGRNDGTKK